MLLRNILIAVILILLAALGFITMKNNEAENQKKIMKTELLTTHSELEKIKDEVDDKIKQIEELGGEVDDLKELRNELLEEKKKLLTNGVTRLGQITRLREKLQGYVIVLEKKDNEIGKLKLANEVLLVENTDLKVEKKQLKTVNDSLQRQNENMEKRVELAAKLIIENVKVTALNKRGKLKKSPLKARQVVTLNVSMNIAENNVAPIEGKIIYFRLLNLHNKPMFDLNNGGGSFILENGKEVIYTKKQEILFDNSKQLLTFTYSQDTRFERGKYEVEFYADNYLIGTSHFTLK